MDRQRFSALAHRAHVYASPVLEPKVDRLLEVLTRALPHEPRVLDLGCGKAGWLLRLAELHAVQGVGIDASGPMLEQALAARAARTLRGAVELRHATLEQFGPARRDFDAVLCIGSDAAFGSLAETLAGLRAWVRPGGVILLGVGYWKQPPHADYLAGLGATVDENGTHAHNGRALADAGYALLYSAVASDDEWDHYEGLYLASIEGHLHEQPDDPDAAVMRARIRPWHAQYLAHGRDTLGFGYYLARCEG